MIEKSPTEEELIQSFVRMLKNDKESFPFLIKFIERMVIDTMTLGEKDFLPVFAITLSVRREGADKLELNIRPVRTTDPETYEAFQLEKLGKLLNDAFKKYGEQVWGMTPLDERDIQVNVSPNIVEAWKNVTKDTMQ